MENLKLFDINGDFGRGAYEEPEFSSTVEILNHMDYLGIERSLVTHVTGRSLNPLWGNRQLLQELNENPDATDRLFPVFTINPADYYESGSMDFLKQAFQSGRVKALALFPGACRFPLIQIERVLKEVASCCPIVLWNTLDSGDNDHEDSLDLIKLAETFPHITFICVKKMWRGFGDVLDAMWRQSNIAIDISWIHMKDNIKLLVREFGADRVFFGTGCKSHYGAAIAALVHADISDEEKRMIANDNIENLLGVGKYSKTAVGGRADKPLWEKCRTGQPLDVEVIDAHGHIGPMNRGWFMLEQDPVAMAENVIKSMDKLGINRLIASSENALFGDALEGSRLTEEKLKPYYRRISGYLAYNPRFIEALQPEMDDFFARGFYIGFKVVAAYWKVQIEDVRFKPMFEYADQHHLPILFHTWDDRWNSPRLLENCVKRYPNAVFLLGHSGGGTQGRIEAIELARNYENVYLEFCGSFTTSYSWEKTISQVGNHRVVFGTDTDVHDQAWELGHLLSQPVPDEILRPILAKNFRAIVSNFLSSSTIFE